MTSKEIIRKTISLRLQSLEKAYIDECSWKVVERVSRNPAFLTSRILCIYLSMAKEIQTESLLLNCFSQQKQVLIPKVIGKQPSDLWMLPIQSIDQINSFPKSKWGIPEPPLTDFSADQDMVNSGCIDLIFVPGVAFDSKCGRVGHGKGYYGDYSLTRMLTVLTIFTTINFLDCFIERATLANERKGYPRPVTIGMYFY